jgi:PurA ssDNA and RNA-binding protein
MITNQRSAPYGRNPQINNGYNQLKYSHPKPVVAEDTLKSAEVQIERKAFVFTLKENPRGRFLRITEDVGGRRDTIIVPSTGLIEFQRLIEEMVKASEAIPDKTQPA